MGSHAERSGRPNMNTSRASKPNAVFTSAGVSARSGRRQRRRRRRLRPFFMLPGAFRDRRKLPVGAREHEHTPHWGRTGQCPHPVLETAVNGDRTRLRP